MARARPPRRPVARTRVASALVGLDDALGRPRRPRAPRARRSGASVLMRVASTAMSSSQRSGVRRPRCARGSPGRSPRARPRRARRAGHRQREAAHALHLLEAVATGEQEAHVAVPAGMEPKPVGDGMRSPGTSWSRGVDDRLGLAVGARHPSTSSASAVPMPCPRNSGSTCTPSQPVSASLADLRLVRAPRRRSSPSTLATTRRFGWCAVRPVGQLLGGLVREVVGAEADRLDDVADLEAATKSAASGESTVSGKVTSSIVNVSVLMLAAFRRVLVGRREWWMLR